MSHSNSSGAFQTHANYLRAFALIASGSVWNRSNALISSLNRAKNSGLLPNSQCKTANKNQAHSSLQNAWGTELLLCLGKRVLISDELVRISNNWSVVQAYYVLYHATQAIAAAKGQSRPESHSKTQNQFLTFFAKRGPGIAPWTLAFGNTGPENLPNGVNGNHRIHSWSQCNTENCWGLAYKALRTTREEAIPEMTKKARERKRTDLRQLWKQEEKQRISTGKKARKEPVFKLPMLSEVEKEKIQKNLRSYTLMDFLYRLRIRTNYEDSAMFTDGPDDDMQSTEVRQDLLNLASCSLLIAELHIRPLIGTTLFDGWVNKWVEANAQFSPALGVADRIRHHKES